MIEQQIIIIFLSILILCMVVLISAILYTNHKNHLQNKIDNLNQENAQKQFKQELDQSLVEVRMNVYENLMKFNEHLNTNMLQNFNSLNASTANRLTEIEKRLNLNLTNNFDQTEKIIVNLNEKMAKISESQNTLKDLSKDLVSLQSILSDKKTRGAFGEVELYTILDNVFGANLRRYERQYKLSNGAIADAVVFLNEGQDKIVIDSKFPLESYNNLCDSTLSKIEQDAARLQFKRDIKKHIDDIANKYLIKNETASVAYMFVPAEAVFAEIYGQHQALVDYSYQRHVFIVSPTTLMAYLTVVKNIMLEQQKDESVREIQSEFVKLGEEFKRFKERYEKINGDFNRIYKEFNDLSITSNKIIKRFEAIDRLDMEDSQDEGILQKNQ